MKKFCKFVLGVTAITAVVGGVYLLIKKSKETDELDFDEDEFDEDDFDEDDFDEELESEISKELRNRSTDEKDYINISVDVPAKEDEVKVSETPEMVNEAEKTTSTVTPVTTETI